MGCDTRRPVQRLTLKTQQFNKLDKPLFIGEVGLRPVVVGSSSRDEWHRSRQDPGPARAGLVGHLVWNWRPGSRDRRLRHRAGRPGPDAPRGRAIPHEPGNRGRLDLVAPFITLNAPNRSLYTLNEPLTDVLLLHGAGELGTQRHATAPWPAAQRSTHQRQITSPSPSRPLTISGTTDPCPTRTTSRPAMSRQRPTGHPATSRPTRVASVLRRLRRSNDDRFTTPSGLPTQFDRPSSAGHRCPEQLAILGNEIDIDLGGLIRPADDPIVITFINTPAPEQTGELTVSRTIADSSPDIALSCDAIPTSNPIPCYVAVYRQRGDVRVTVYTTHPSRRSPFDGPTETTCRYVDSDRHTRFERWYHSNIGVSWTKTDAQSTILTSSERADHDRHRYRRNDPDLLRDERRRHVDDVGHGQA